MKTETEKYIDNLNTEKIKISIPAILFHEGEMFTIMTTDESEKIIGQPLFASGKSQEEAENKIWELMRYTNKFHIERSNELDKYKFFQHGSWGKMGGNWFSILGINVYFRKGEGMKGGWYVPLTKLNISIHNHWIKSKKKLIK